MLIKNIKSKNNNDISLFNIGYKNAENKTILIIGVVHGEEPQGKKLIEDYLNSNPKTKNNILLIPCLNPDGMVENKRQNANGVDINRNFPTKNWGEDCQRPNKDDYFGGKSPASELETKFVLEIIEQYEPSVILTIHSPYKVVNYDGPAEKIAQKISDIIGYPVTNDIGYPTPGSMGNYAGVERNIPIITLELDEEKSVEELKPSMIEIFDYLAELQ